MSQKKNSPLIIPAPPEGIFAGATARDAILEQRGVANILEKVECPSTGGIFVYIQGAKFPRKGYPYPEAIWAINIAKSSVIESMRLLSSKELWLLFPLFLLPHKRKVAFLEKLIRSWYKIVGTVIAPHQLLPQYETPFAQEIGAFTYDFCVKYGINSNESGMVANIIRAIFEYDDAYRYRLQDIFSETSKNVLIYNSRKEITRLVGIMCTRERFVDVVPKIKRFSRLISLFLLSPRIKKAFKSAILASAFNKLQLDEADKYWCSLRGDYDYFGTKYEDRGVTPLIGYELGK